MLNVVLIPNKCITFVFAYTNDDVFAVLYKHFV